MSEREPSAPDTMTEVEAELEGIEVDAPRVGIVMGSKTDMPEMEKAAQELEERGISYEIRVMSAHRDPEVVADYAKNAHMRGLRVIIAGAGLSATTSGSPSRRCHRACPSPASGSTRRATRRSSQHG